MKLGDICEVLNGYAFKSENYVSSGLRIVRIANVQKGYVEDNNPVFYPIDSAGLEKYMLEEDDLLVSLTGNVGRIALLPKKLLPAVLNQRVACLRLKSDNVLKEYLYHFLNSNLFEIKCIKAANGVAQKNASTEWLKKFEVPIVSREKQTQIVNTLNRAKHIIEVRKAQLSELDSLIKSRFVEMFGSQKTNAKAWNQDKLSNLLLIERGGSPRPIDSYITESEDGVNWIKISDAEQGSIYITKAKQKILKTGIKKSRRVESGDFLLSNSMSFGRPYILKIDGYIHDGWLVLRDINGLFNNLYLYSALSSDYSYSQFCSSAAGAVVNNLNKDIVGKLVIAVPPKEVQNQFAEFVNQVDKSKFVKL